MANATAGIAELYSGVPVDVLTYHYDNNRTGWNPNETDLNQVSVASPNFGLLQTLNVDGNVFAQPLLVSNFVMPDTTVHDVLIVATGNDTVYAFDAQTYAILWKRPLGTPIPYADVNCDEVRPTFGITSTPVIIRHSASAATIFVVAATEPSPGVFETHLHAIKLANGSDAKPGVEINPSATLSDGSTLAFDPQNQYSRAGLAVYGTNIYVGIGSHCDNNWGNISGWLLRYNTALKPLSAFHTINTPHLFGGSRFELASIWMSGFAPAIDGAGNVFVSTGNGDYTGGGAKDWGESVLRLSVSLSNVTSRFTPANYSELNEDDLDISSGGVMLLPTLAGQTTPPLAVVLGKSATLYLLNRSSLGGLKTGDSGASQSMQLADATSARGDLGGTGLWGGPAYYNGLTGQMIYAQIDSDVLRSFAINPTTTPVMSAAATGSSVGGNGGSIPIVSSNGSGTTVVPGSEIVWLIRRSVPIQLEAYNATTLGAPIYTATLSDWSNPDMENSILTPMVANGRVYVPGPGTVSVFGLSQ